MEDFLRLDLYHWMIYNIKVVIMKKKLVKSSDSTLNPPSLSELTPIIFNVDITHLGSKTSFYWKFDCMAK